MAELFDAVLQVSTHRAVDILLALLGHSGADFVYYFEALLFGCNVLSIRVVVLNIRLGFDKITIEIANFKEDFFLIPVLLSCEGP